MSISNSRYSCYKKKVVRINFGEHQNVADAYTKKISGTSKNTSHIQVILLFCLVAKHKALLELERCLPSLTETGSLMQSPWGDLLANNRTTSFCMVASIL
jgi:hypothetical protein